MGAAICIRSRVVGYHMLAGETPFKAANTPAMLVKHVSERPRPIRERRPEVPAYLAVAIDRALAKRPEDRWADAAEFRDALDGAQTSPNRGWRRRRRQRFPTSRFSTRRPQSRAASSDVAVPRAAAGTQRGELRRWYKAQRVAMAERR